MVMRKPAVAVFDMSRGTIRLYTDSSRQELGKPALDFADIDFSRCYAKVMKMKLNRSTYGQPPAGIKLLRDFPSLVIGVRLEDCQFFFFPLAGALVEKAFKLPPGAAGKIQPLAKTTKMLNRHNKNAASQPPIEYPVLGEKICDSKDHFIGWFILESWIKAQGLVSLQDKDTGATHLVDSADLLSNTKAVFKEPTSRIA